MAPPSKKRKTNSSAPAEITFDFSAREEYLTGFHKRKQARIKHAQEQAAKQEKEERLRLRKQLRDQRKEGLEKHVNEVNALLRKANGDLSEGGEEEDEGEDPFEGFDEPEPEVVNREEEYIDEDKYTTVTIESVGISREGFEKAGEDKEEEGRDKENDVGIEDAGKNGTGNSDGRKVWTKEKPKTDRPKKKKKQKFRYESKAERKMTRAKQGAKNRKQAEARKGK